MTPLLDEVYQGIAGFRHNDPNVLSCTALGLDCQSTEMEHDMFTGELLKISY